MGLLKLILSLELILDKHKGEYKLPSDAAAEFKKIVESIYQLNATLAHHFHNQNIVLFNCTIKFHYLLHLGHLAQYLNPRMAWCYTGEDLMHAIKKLVQSSHRGTPPHKVVHKVVVKYMYGFGRALQKRLWKK